MLGGKRGERFHAIVSEVALPFANGAVPTLPVFGDAYQQLVRGLHAVYPEVANSWDLLKAGSTGYVTRAAILSHPTFSPTRTAIGLLSSRVGDGAHRQEWVFGSTGPDDPVVYTTLRRGTRESPVLKHTNALASLVLERGSTDFGPFRTSGGAPRLADHWPAWTGFTEVDLRSFLEAQDASARKLVALDADRAG